MGLKNEPAVAKTLNKEMIETIIYTIALFGWALIVGWIVSQIDN